jgi:hypothetical protein
MATTVNTAFSEFMRERVNLDAQDTRDARASRDWLMKQIEVIPENDPSFPRLYPEVNIHFGSFARRTKIRELDDIDILVGIGAVGTTYLDRDGWVELTVPEGIALRRFCHDGSAVLNSRRVVNLFVSTLSKVPQYANSELKRNGEAAVVNLTSYTWSFDIVPAFFTVPEPDGRTYYIIPDGNGHWKKTDPRLDHDRVQRINQVHDGNMLNPLRLMKYWNGRPTMPSIPSYLLECIVLSYYEAALNKASSYVDVEAVSLLAHISTAVTKPIYDPKRIQGDINELTWEERIAISARASTDANRAAEARRLEDAGNHRQAISRWREILGSHFPEFG